MRLSISKNISNHTMTHGSIFLLNYLFNCTFILATKLNFQFIINFTFSVSFSSSGLNYIESTSEIEQKLIFQIYRENDRELEQKVFEVEEGPEL